ncbi:MAG: D-amino-acid transaminase [Gammaproteobacteria bacterium]|nr:D-amino-acid transaminase [Gammaproteobacteria bacterium]
MSRTVYVNGSYLPESEAKISVFDRGFLFADGVYEVTSVIQGKLIDNRRHLQRLGRSLDALEMHAPADIDEIERIQHELIRRNSLDEGLIYLQVTRGAADRDFSYPAQAEPSLVMFSQSKEILRNPLAATGIKVITVADIRWLRRDIKSIGLLAPCMAKMAAKKAGADDAWMVDGDRITEGSSNNAYIVDHEGNIVTRQLGHDILSGITRRAILELAAATGIDVQERPFTIDEAHAAREAFITSASTLVLPVVEIDGRTIGEGTPGPVAKRLRELYIEMAIQSSSS